MAVRSSRVGLNYGHVDTSYTNGQIDSDLTYLSGLGFNKLRVALPSFSSGGSYTQLKYIIEKALSLDFYVIWGVTCPSNFTGAQWTSFKTEVEDNIAPYAQSLNNANFELSIGNELELKNNGSGAPDDATVRSELKTLAAACQAIYTVGPISYQADSAQISAWASLGITPDTDIDKLGFNLYSNTASFTSSANLVYSSFGLNGYVSEWSDESGYTFTNREDDFYDNVLERLRILDRSQVPAHYFFTYNHTEGSWGVTDAQYNLLLEDGVTKRTAFRALTNERVIVWRRPVLSQASSKSINFNGTSDLATIPITPSVDGFCIAFWMKKTTEAGKWISFKTGGSEDGFEILRASGDRVTMQIHNDTSITANMSTATGTISQGKWYHVALTYAPNNAGGYLNGVKFANDGSCQMSDAPGQSLTIGRNSYSGAGFGGLKISRLTFQNTTTPWTKEQIKDLMYSNTLPAGSRQYSMNNVATDDQGANALTLTGISYVDDVPSFMNPRTTVANRFSLSTTSSQKSLSLNGASAYATIPVVPATTGFNFGIWINWANKRGFSATERILNWADGGPTNGFLFQKGGSTETFSFVLLNGGSSTVNQSFTPPKGKFFHVAITFAPNNWKMFINGVETYTDTSCAMSTASAAFTMSVAATNLFGGLLKNFTFQNTTTPWTQQQITDLYYRNIIPDGAIGYSFNDVATDQNGENALTLSGTSYSTNVPPHMGVRTQI